MNRYKQDYITKKEEILRCLKEAESYFIENELTHQASVINTSIEKLESGEFSISVVGEFSAGKSTFLNALMGEKILPSFTNETTATINYLRHKDRAPNGESGIVYYNDGRTEVIHSADLDTISRYVCTNSDVDVAKNVSHLDLFLDSRFLENNVTIVDTPGLNGIAEGHKEITQGQIERSSAGIFLFSAAQPGSKSDFEYLSELRERVNDNSIILVLNKVDLIPDDGEDSIKTVVDKLKENYKKKVPDAKTIPEIWPVAAYPSLVARSKKKLDYMHKTDFSEAEKQGFETRSGMKEFEDRLWRFLTQGEKAKQELLAPLTQLIAQLYELRKSNEKTVEALSGSVDLGKIEDEEIAINKALSDLNSRLDELTSEIKQGILQAEDDFYGEVKTNSEKFKDRYIKKISEFVDIDEIDPEHIKKVVEKGLQKIQNDALDNYCYAVKGIMAKNAAVMSEMLNESLEEGLEVNINSEIELRSLKVGLEEYEKKAEKLNEEIERLEEAASAAGNDAIEAISIEMQRKELEKKLELLESKKELLNEQIANAPGVKLIQKHKMVETGWGIFKKQLPVIDTIQDDTERREYISRKESSIQQCDNRIQEIEKKLSELPKNEKTLKEKLLEDKNSELSKKRNELEAFEKQYSDEVKKKMKKTLELQKASIEDYIDEAVSGFEKNSKRQFRDKLKSQIEMIQDIVGKEITESISIKMRELDSLKRKLTSAVSERDSEIERLQVQNNAIIDLLRKADDIKREIDDIDADVIEQQTL